MGGAGLGVGVLGLEVGQRLRRLLVAQPLVVVDERRRRGARGGGGRCGPPERVGISAMATTLRPRRCLRHQGADGGRIGDGRPGPSPARGPQRRPRRGGHRRPGAARGRHLRQRRLRLPRRRRRPHAGGLRDGRRARGPRRCAGVLPRPRGLRPPRPRRRRRRADRAGRRPGGPARATPRARRDSTWPTSSRTARSTTGSWTTRSRPPPCWPGPGRLPVLGLPGGRRPALARGGGPRDVPRGLPRPRLPARRG